MIAKPKPTKADREKKHKASKPRRKIVEQQLEDICRAVIFWRDGCDCVEKEIDGVRCGGGVQWGHFIPRQQSRWLKWDLSNTFCQCRNHNNLHDKGAQTMGVWFADTFGSAAGRALEAERDAHRGQKNRTVEELETLIRHYDSLYQNRYYVKNDDISDLIRLGYYGSIIAKTAPRGAKDG